MPNPVVKQVYVLSVQTFKILLGVQVDLPHEAPQVHRFENNVQSSPALLKAPRAMALRNVWSA